MKPGGWPALRPGDWVHFDGAEYQVVALADMAVRLRPDAGPEQVVLASYLMGVPGFAVVGGEPLPEMVPFGLLDGRRASTASRSDSGSASCG